MTMRTQNLGGKPGNRRLTDIVAARDAALCLAGLDPFARFLLLMGSEFRLAAEFDAFLLGVGPAARGALDDATALQLGGNAKHGQDKLGKVRGCIDNRLGNGAQARPGALDVAGDHQKIGRVARETVNGRGDHDIAGGEGLHQPGKLRPVGRGAGDLLAENVLSLASGGAELVELVGEVLGGGRDAGTAVNHARDSASEIRFKKG